MNTHTVQRIRFAEKEAQKLLDLYWNRRIPVDPFRIAELLGLDSREEEMAQSLYGRLDKRRYATVSVTVNASLSPQNKRYCGAYFLGMFVLNTMLKHEMTYSRSLSRGLTPDPDYLFAHQFAQALLMPRSDFLAHLDAGREMDQICETFDVTPMMAGWRMDSVGRADARKRLTAAV